MQITLYQIIVPLFSWFAVLYAWNLVWRRKKSVWQAVLWTMFWVFIGAIALFPDLLYYLTLVTGIQDRVNAVFITSFGVLFFLVFYLVMKTESLQQEHHLFIRRVALREFKERLQKK